MLDPLAEIVRRADAGQRFAIALLARTTGSTPQKAGALLLIDPAGHTVGTIGGGCVEAEVRARALQQLAQRAEANAHPSAPALPETQLHRFALDDDYGWDDGLVCGGTMFVALQLIEAAHHADPWRTAHAALLAGQPATVTLAARDEQNQPHDLHYHAQPPPHLVIAGAGHVGAALAAVAHPAGFHITILDDRPDVIAAEPFAHATQRVGPIAETLLQLELATHDHVVIVTRGHRHDADALRAAVQPHQHPHYLGLIGSRRKILTIFETLLREGIPPETLARVRAPIGLRIGAISPHEIAISIAAELIAARHRQPLPQEATMQLDPAHVERLLHRHRK